MAAEERFHSGDIVRVAELNRALQDLNRANASPLTASALAASPLPTASASVPVSAAAEAPVKQYKDGAWYGWGYCRHGQLKVIIEIKDDVITAAWIDECYTRYSKNVISSLPKRVIERQSANVGWISGATQSSDAFYYAVTEALKAAKL